MDTTKEGKIVFHPSTNKFFNSNLKMRLCSLLAVVHTLSTISAQFEYTASSLKSNLCRKQMLSRKLQQYGQFFRKIMYQCRFLFTYVTRVHSFSLLHIYLVSMSQFLEDIRQLPQLGSTRKTHTYILYRRLGGFLKAPTSHITQPPIIDKQ